MALRPLRGARRPAPADDAAAVLAEPLLTERLLLRRPTAEDLPGFVALCADPLVMKYIGRGEPLDRASAERGFALIASHWDLHGYGLRSARLRDSGEYLGFVGLARVPPPSVGAGKTEIGWRLKRDAWARGYA